MVSELEDVMDITFSLLKSLLITGASHSWVRVLIDREKKSAKVRLSHPAET